MSKYVFDTNIPNGTKRRSNRFVDRFIGFAFTFYHQPIPLLINTNPLRRNHKPRALHTHILKPRSPQSSHHLILHSFLRLRQRHQRFSHLELALLHLLHASTLPIPQFSSLLLHKRRHDRHSLFSLHLHLHTLPVRQQLHQNALHAHELLHDHRFQRLGGLHQLDYAQCIARKMHLMQQIRVRKQRFQHAAVRTGRQRDDLIAIRLRKEGSGEENPHERVGQNDEGIVSNAAREWREHEVLAVRIETEKRGNASDSTMD